MSKLLSGLPASRPPAQLRERLHAEFQMRYGTKRSAWSTLLGAWERIAGGHRGWAWASGALVLATLPGLAGGAAQGGFTAGLPCVIVETSVGLLLGGALVVVTRGLPSRGAIVAVAAVGTVLADAGLGLRCPDWFATSHVMAFHLSGIVLAILLAGVLHARLRAA